ncbi:MAG: nickel pincer cofactor biosynthesis protein LarC [Deltaproteobacteria bacterium]|nr:nickel pincer cofactor biosynthesis protein LarC [Deltaproteobacteria bacterium]
MKIAYLDCFSGISGDMMVGAFIDAGLPLEKLESEIKKLPLDGYRLSCERVKKNGIDAAKFSVHLEKEQHHRHYSDIRDIIEKSSLKDEVKKMSLSVFAAIAEAEGKVHAIPPEKVHFHEVGAIDSIVDIVGAAIGMDHFRIASVATSPLVTGTGIVKCDHGPMPIPAPATAELLKGVPFAHSEEKFELVTPTGAAIVNVLASSHGEIPPMSIETIGYGAGEKDLHSRPNLLRVFLGEAEHAAGSYEEDTVLVLEASIDDMNPQFFEPLVEELFEAGALDVAMMPLYMKKYRPATLLQVIIPETLKDKAAAIIFRGSTTIGIRSHLAKRSKLRRSERKILTSFGEVRVKEISGPGGIKALRPEYDELKRLSTSTKLSIVQVNLQVQRELMDYMDK